MVNLKKELMGDDNSILVIIPSKKYYESEMKIYKTLTNKKGYKGILVTVNRTYSSLLKILKKEKIKTGNLFFIDAITKSTTAQNNKNKNCLFTESPESLTELSIAIDQIVKSMDKGKRFLVIDSLTTLVTYNNANSVLKFSHFLINKLRSSDVMGVMLILKEGADTKLVSQLSQFVDKIVNIGGKKK